MRVQWYLIIQRKEATTLTLKLEATMYIPCIEVVAMTKTYNFCDNSIITSETDSSKRPCLWRSYSKSCCKLELLS